MNLLRNMHIFTKIVERGSLSAAATECGVSSTMVSNYLAGLESYMGAKLLVRTTRRQQLTEVGRAFYERCIDARRLINEIEDLANAVHDHPKGVLRVTAPTSFGTYCLAPVIGKYLDTNKDVQIDLVLSDDVFDLADAGFEAAIRIGSLPDSTLVARSLRPYKMAVCASTEYIEKYGTPQTPRDLTDRNCLSYSYPQRSEWRQMRTRWEFRNSSATQNISVSGNIAINNAQALRQALLQGVGIVMLPEILVESEINDRTVLRLFPDFELPSREMNIVYFRDRTMSPKLKSFINFVAERFRPTS